MWRIADNTSFRNRAFFVNSNIHLLHDGKQKQAVGKRSDDHDDPKDMWILHLILEKPAICLGLYDLFRFLGIERCRTHTSADCKVMALRESELGSGVFALGKADFLAWVVAIANHLFTSPFRSEGRQCRTSLRAVTDLFDFFDPDVFELCPHRFSGVKLHRHDPVSHRHCGFVVREIENQLVV